MNDQIKLQQMWKAINVDNYPLKIALQAVPSSGVSTRAAKKGRLIEIGNSNVTQITFTSDAIRIWNKAPRSVTDTITLFQAKNAIKGFVLCLPI